MNKIRVKNIFAAVFEKSVLDPLLEVLGPKEVKFWGTGGTVNYLKLRGFRAQSVVLGFDFGGRVKSLDKKIFAAILADRLKKTHLEELSKLGVEPIDLVVVGLYRPDPKNFPESMDIGGQSLIRSAIKNYHRVALAFDEKSIKDLVSEITENKWSTSLAFRKKQAAKALKFIAKRCQEEVELSR